MALTWWHSPAKLNLFLHITGRLDNGYHSLQSVFQMLDFGDSLAFELADDINMATQLDGVNDNDNLIIKAARLLRDYANVKNGCRIHLNKQLPMGGGVGGGSSNAATTLLVLNHLWQLNIDNKTLSEIGLKLGADVPVFINGKTTFAEGVGEKFTDISIPERWYLVCHPHVHVSTQSIFTADDLPRNTPKIQPNDYSFDKTHNDCQEIACQRHPEVANLLQWLLQFAPSRMTGTGACVFAVFDAEQEATNALSQLPEKWSGFVTKGVQTSPLHLQLSDQKC